jgi:lipoprotein-anchoring transpeptidase ErfK/SrfK
LTGAGKPFIVKDVKKFSIISFFVLFLASFFLLRNKQAFNKTEPLADPVSLSKLIAGEILQEPADEHYAVFHGTEVTPPLLARIRQTSRILGATSPNDKRIEVDLTNQKVYAYEGNNKIFDFTVSTGKWGKTPTGTFHIWAKVRSQLMSGGNPDDGTYYYLPNVPYVEFFYNNEIAKSMGYSFHGTYWHHNFGHPMSHGCVNMRTEDAAKLYGWTTPEVTNPKAWSTLASAANPGTEVAIYGIPPAE